MDILQQAILDVNRIKEVGMKAAQKKLIEKYSKDLKKLYLQEAAELGADDEDILGDDQMGDSPDGLGDSPEGSDINLDPQGGDQELQSGESLGQEPNLGLEPQNEPTVMDNLPRTDEDEDLSIEIFVTEEQPELSEDVIDISDVENATKNLQQGYSSAPPQPGLEGALEANQDSNIGSLQSQSEFDEDLDEEFDQDIFDSLKKDIHINDEVLYEYIEKSMNNEEKFSKLEKTIEGLEKIIEKLSSQLEKTNSNLQNIKEQNIRLIYKNQTLIDDSLSEHQKKNIVAALDKANTITEAKSIYEALKKIPGNKNSQNTLDRKLSQSSVTKKFITESKKQVIEESKQEKLPELAKKLFDKWGI